MYCRWKEGKKNNNNNNNNNNNLITIMDVLEGSKQSWEALKDELNLT